MSPGPASMSVAVGRHPRVAAAHDPRLRVRVPMQVRPLPGLVVHEKHGDAGAVGLTFEPHGASGRFGGSSLDRITAVHGALLLVRGSLRRQPRRSSGTTIAQASTTSSRISIRSIDASRTTAQLYRRLDGRGIMNLSGSDSTSASRNSFGSAKPSSASSREKARYTIRPTRNFTLAPNERLRRAGQGC